MILVKTINDGLIHQVYEPTNDKNFPQYSSTYCSRVFRWKSGLNRPTNVTTEVGEAVYADRPVSCLFCLVRRV